MITYLDEDKLMRAFKGCKAAEPDETDSFGRIFGTRPEDRDLFLKLKRVMEARTPEDIEDLSVEDLLHCWEEQEKFVALFDSDKAGDYFSHVLERFPKYQNRARRRLL